MFFLRQRDLRMHLRPMSSPLALCLHMKTLAKAPAPRNFIGCTSSREVT